MPASADGREEARPLIRYYEAKYTKNSGKCGCSKLFIVKKLPVMSNDYAATCSLTNVSAFDL